MGDPIDIVERLREALRKAESHPVPAGNAEPVIFVSPTALRAVLCELDELRRENFALAAGQCANAIGDEGGTPVCAEITRLRAALAQPVPAGWQVAPVEPTQDMEDAALREITDCAEDFADPDLRVDFRVSYRAALAAAPQAPQPGAQGPSVRAKLPDAAQLKPSNEET